MDFQFGFLEWWMEGVKMSINIDGLTCYSFRCLTIEADLLSVFFWKKGADARDKICRFVINKTRATDTDWPIPHHCLPSMNQRGTEFDERVCYPLWLQNKSGGPLNVIAVDERADPSLKCYLMKYFFTGEWKTHALNTTIMVRKYLVTFVVIHGIRE